MSTQDNLVDANELEAALAHMKQMQNDQLTAPPRWGFWTRICHTKKNNLHRHQGAVFQIRICHKNPI